MDCLFCSIIEGDIPSRRIYEDDDSYAFLDIGPWQVGHTLVIPKRHTADVLEDERTLGELAPAVHTVGNLLKERLGASAVNVLSNAGADSGQEVFHSHVHLIPRYPESPGIAGMRGHVDEDLDVTHKRICD